MRNSFLCLQHHSLLVSLMSLMMMTSATVSATSVDSIFAVPCPSDPTLQGYTSLRDLNLEMKRHKSFLAPPLLETPQAQYKYHLCPHTTFDGAEQLTPLLDRTLVQCGRSGSAQDNCIIQGGTTQVLLVDTLPLQHRIFVFQGITFTSSTDVSIAAYASSQTRAEFYDCHWKVRLHCCCFESSYRLDP